MKRFILIALIGLVFSSCTENSRARNWGGTMEIVIPAGNKVTNITWKKTDLWYSYRPFEEGEKPARTIFKEESSFGVMTGTIVFIESDFNGSALIEKGTTIKVRPEDQLKTVRDGTDN